MPDVKLSNKDITIAILIVFVAFVGIPLLAWGYSNWRMNETVRKVTPEIKYIIESNTPDAELLVQAISDEHNLRTPGSRAYNSYPKSKQLTGEICRKLTKSISDNTVFDELGIRSDYYYPNCKIGYITAEGGNIFISSSSVNEQKSLNKEYKDDLDEMLESSNELPINIHSHKDQRSVHVVTLLNQEPVLLWDILLYTNDRY